MFSQIIIFPKNISTTVLGKKIVRCFRSNTLSSLKSLCLEYGGRSCDAQKGGIYQFTTTTKTLCSTYSPKWKSRTHMWSTNSQRRISICGALTCVSLRRRQRKKFPPSFVSFSPLLPCAWKKKSEHLIWYNRALCPRIALPLTPSFSFLFSRT